MTGDVGDVVPAKSIDDDEEWIADVPNPLVPEDDLVVEPGSARVRLQRFRREFWDNNSVYVNLRYVFIFAFNFS